MNETNSSIVIFWSVHKYTRLQTWFRIRAIAILTKHNPHQLKYDRHMEPKRSEAEKYEERVPLERINVFAFGSQRGWMADLASCHAPTRACLVPTRLPPNCVVSAGKEKSIESNPLAELRCP